MRNLIFLFILVSMLASGQAFAQTEETKTILNYTTELHALQFDAIIHIKRNTSERDFAKSLRSIKTYDQEVKIEYKRNEKGEIRFLKFKNISFECSSDSFGSLIIVIDEDKIKSCGIVDIDHM